VLTDDQIKWIVKQKVEDNLKNEEIRRSGNFSNESIKDVLYTSIEESWRHNVTKEETFMSEPKSAKNV